MNKHKSVGLIMLSFMMALVMGLGLLTGCFESCSPVTPPEHETEPDPPVVTKTLDSVTLDTEGVKTVYDLGEAVSYEGLLIYANFAQSDNTSYKTELTLADVKIETDYNAAVLGEYTVTVTYTYNYVPKSASYTVTVKEPDKAGLELTWKEGAGETIVLGENKQYADLSSAADWIEVRMPDIYGVVDYDSEPLAPTEYNLVIGKDNKPLEDTVDLTKLGGGIYQLWVTKPYEKDQTYLLSNFITINVDDDVVGLEFNEEAEGTLLTQGASVIEEIMSATWQFTVTYASGAEKTVYGNDSAITIEGLAYSSMTGDEGATATVTYTEKNASGVAHTTTSVTVTYVITATTETQVIVYETFDAKALANGDALIDGVIYAEADYTTGSNTRYFNVDGVSTKFSTRIQISSANKLKVTVSGPSVITLYCISGSGTIALNLYGSDDQGNVDTAAIANMINVNNGSSSASSAQDPYKIVVEEAGTYYFATASGSCNIFRIAVTSIIPASGETIDCYHVNFNENYEGGAITAQTVIGYPDYNIATVSDPVRIGWNFLGWNTAADGSGDDVDLSKPVVSDITLYAQWEEGEVTGITAAIDPSEYELYGQSVLVDLSKIAVFTNTGVTVNGNEDYTITYRVYGAEGTEIAAVENNVVTLGALGDYKVKVSAAKGDDTFETEVALAVKAVSGISATYAYTSLTYTVGQEGAVHGVDLTDIVVKTAAGNELGGDWAITFVLKDGAGEQLTATEGAYTLAEGEYGLVVTAARGQESFTAEAVTITVKAVEAGQTVTVTSVITFNGLTSGDYYGSGDNENMSAIGNLTVSDESIVSADVVHATGDKLSIQTTDTKITVNGNEYALSNRFSTQGESYSTRRAVLLELADESLTYTITVYANGTAGRYVGLYQTNTLPNGTVKLSGYSVETDISAAITPVTVTVDGADGKCVYVGGTASIYIYAIVVTTEISETTEQNVDYVLDASGLTVTTDTLTEEVAWGEYASVLSGCKINASSKTIALDDGTSLKVANRVQTVGSVTTTQKSIKLTLTAGATITVYAIGGGTGARTVKLLDSTGVAVFESESIADSSTMQKITITVEEAGTYYLGGSNGFNFYYISVNY